MSQPGNSGYVQVPLRVEEFQGLYGPYHVGERLVQKIWLNGELDLRRLATLEGEGIRVLNRGEWNLLGGPDFIGAEIEIGGRRLTGDIEIHFRQADWFAHGHQDDPAYDRVILHLVLFPPAAAGRLAKTSGGREIRTAVLIDLLWYDMEEYASSEAAAEVSSTSDHHVLEALLEVDPDGRRERLVKLASERWRLKVHFAGIRMSKLGWREAGHATVLEVLGYSRNRSAMLAVADRHPLDEWAEEGFDPAQALSEETIPWRKQGIRPSNQPRRRLAEYAAMAAGDVDWVSRLVTWSEALPETAGEADAGAVQVLRRRLGLSRARSQMKTGVLNGAIHGPRADTVVIDAMLPMLAAGGRRDLFPWWFAWPVGDMPARFRTTLKQSGVAGTSRVSPFANGWFQGVLGLLLDLKNS